HAGQRRCQVGHLDLEADPLFVVLQVGQDYLPAGQLHVLGHPVGGVDRVQRAQFGVVLLEVHGHVVGDDQLVAYLPAGGDLPHNLRSSWIRRSLPPAERGAAPGARSVTFTPMPTTSRILCWTSRTRRSTGSSACRAPSSPGVMPRPAKVAWSSSRRSSISSRVFSLFTTSW